MRYKLMDSPPKPKKTHPVILRFLQESPWFVEENDVHNISELNLECFVMPKALASGNYDLIYHLANEYGLTATDISGFMKSTSGSEKFKTFQILDSQMDLASLYPYFFEASIKNKALPFIDLFIHKNTNLDYVRDLFNALDSSGDLESRQIAAKETLESLEIVICHDNLCNYAVREINFEPSTLQTIKEVMPQDMFDRLLNKIDKNKLLTSLESDLEMKTSKPKIKI